MNLRFNCSNFWPLNNWNENYDNTTTKRSRNVTSYNLRQQVYKVVLYDSFSSFHNAEMMVPLCVTVPRTEIGAILDKRNNYEIGLRLLLNFFNKLITTPSLEAGV